MGKTGPKRTFNPTHDELDALYQTHSMAAIAALFGVGETVIWNRVKECGLVRKDGRRKKYKPRTRSHSLNISLAKRGKWSGEKNPNWKGGVHDKHLAVRRTGEYRQWKLEVLHRAGDCCQGCGAKRGAICECCGTKIILQVHHIKPFARHPELRFDVSNGAVLCPKCHHSRHHGKIG